MNDDAWHKRDLDAVYAIYADDVILHSPPFPPVVGKEANQQADAGILTAFRDSLRHSSMVVEGNLAVVRWTWEATHIGLVCCSSLGWSQRSARVWLSPTRPGEGKRLVVSAFPSPGSLGVLGGSGTTTSCTLKLKT